MADKPVLRLPDLLDEASAGVMQRPGRSLLTIVGAVLGIGTFVTVIGVSQTAAGQVDSAFDALKATQVYVNDVAATSGDRPVLSFPPDSEERARQVGGVTASGVWWPISLGGQRGHVSALPLASDQETRSLDLIAATPGLFQAADAFSSVGTVFNRFHETEALPVAVLGQAAADQLGIRSVRELPAIFVDGQPLLVIGILEDAPALPSLTLSVILPSRTAVQRWGLPRQDAPARMLVRTAVGAAGIVAQQLALAVRPDQPASLNAVPPLENFEVADQVGSDLNTLFLVLAAVAVATAALGIANTTLVAVLERTPEIGLRRALGARRRHISGQFLTESSLLGLAGGLIGATVGLSITLIVAMANSWTALVDARVLGLSPAAGAAIGLCAGIYPSLKAARIPPAVALRR